MEKVLLSNALVEGELQEFVISVTTDIIAVSATALVGIGSVLVSLALVWVTRQNQKSQNSLHSLNIKLASLDKLQETGARFISLVARTGNLVRNGKAVDSPDVLEAHSEMLFYQSSLVLMLPSSDVSKKIVSLVNDATKDILSEKTSAEDISKHISEIGHHLKILLKMERTALLDAKT
ncbi:hypothetical protein M2G36_20410 [Vibrio vulnificus]|uniref:hypothetical protein n=1 Tax=Vibrio cholerae TaxID=666 RepID=UPI00096B7915|nr:hypothetical protein [Vibrio cholerae]EJO3996211.1 hypothetical protein [Vibrio vulnificus]EGR0659914.1 hypothetical protein [Vibrio cholerae]EJL6706476.1 hypothetical protein [Vibrio cholerae]ELG4788246.1 hypothetical protein [Vibrio vulnificus]MBO1386649.1 hypothetical protein [Vibrio cholerae]